MYVVAADLTLSTPLAVLFVGLLLGGLVSMVAALRTWVRQRHAQRAGRASLKVSRAHAAAVQERTRRVSQQAVSVRRGAETDMERLARLRAEVQVRSRGAVGGEGGAL